MVLLQRTDRESSAVSLRCIQMSIEQPMQPVLHKRVQTLHLLFRLRQKFQEKVSTTEQKRNLQQISAAPIDVTFLT